MWRKAGMRLQPLIVGPLMDAPSFNSVLDSAEVQAFATGFPTTVAHLVTTLLLLAVGVMFYVWLTPWKEIALVRQGNTAAALALSGILVGLAVPLAVSLSISTSLKDIVLWGVAAVVLQLLAFRVVDMILTGLPQRIRDGEVSAAVVLVGAKLATALILAAALTG